jgi:hypothetical protein
MLLEWNPPDLTIGMIERARFGTDEARIAFSGCDDGCRGRANPILLTDVGRQLNFGTVKNNCRWDRKKIVDAGQTEDFQAQNS